MRGNRRFFFLSHKTGWRKNRDWEKSGKRKIKTPDGPELWDGPGS